MKTPSGQFEIETRLTFLNFATKAYQKFHTQTRQSKIKKLIDSIWELMIEIKGTLPLLKIATKGFEIAFASCGTGIET